MSVDHTEFLKIPMDCVPYRWLGRCLAPDSTWPTVELLSCLDAPSWTWEALMAQAHRGLVAGVLYDALVRRGLLERLPEALREHLHSFQTLIRNRNEQLRQALPPILARCQVLGIEPLLLKGAIPLLSGPCSRILSDLDLLIPQEALPRCQRRLQTELGYREVGDAFFPEHERHHAPPLLHPTRNIRIELHTQPLPQRFTPILDAKVLRETAESAQFRGYRVRYPDPTRRFAHIVLHDFVVDHGLRDHRCDLRQWYDLAQIRDQTRDNLDWDWLREHLARTPEGRALLPTGLLLLHALFGQIPPPEIPISTQAYRQCHQLLLGLQQPRRVFRNHWLNRIRGLPRRLLAPSWYLGRYRKWRAGHRTHRSAP